MTVLSAQSIRSRSKRSHRPLIAPFVEAYEHPSGKSGGLSSASYDVHSAQDILLWPWWCGPWAKRLASTIERFDIDRDLVVLVLNKSTTAREWTDASWSTLVDPGWSPTEPGGPNHLTLEIANFSWWFRFIGRGEPAAQLLFMKLDEPTDQPYTAKKYSGQPDRPVGPIRRGAEKLIWRIARPFIGRRRFVPPALTSQPGDDPFSDGAA